MKSLVGITACFLCSSSWAFVGLGTTRQPASSLLTRFSTAASLKEGILKTVSKPGNGKPLRVGDVATIKYNCYVPGSDEIFAKSNSQKIVVGDGSFVDGWETAIKTMEIGERAVIRIQDPNLAYGETGVPPVVPPNAQVEFDVEILQAQPPVANIDFDSLATADSTPRTAGSIAAAYEARLSEKALEPQLEGLDAWVAKIKNFYFFGLFEGETGQKAPWFLRPSITFPLAFAIVGAAFYVSFVGGAISERGAQIKDDLDEIILSSAAVSPASLTAVAMTMFLK